MSATALDESRTFPRLYVPDDSPDSAEALSNDLLGMAEYVAIPSTAPLFEPPPTSDDVCGNPLFRRRYLVLLAGLCEDVPCGLFDHPEEAVLYARDVKGSPDQAAEPYYRAVGASLFPRVWLSVSVVEFSGPLPHRRTELFDLS